MMILPLLCALGSAILITPTEGKKIDLDLGSMEHGQRIHFLGTCEDGLCEFWDLKVEFLEGDVDLYVKEGSPYLGWQSCYREECVCAGTTNDDSEETCVELSRKTLDTFVLTVRSAKQSSNVKLSVEGNIKNLDRLSSDAETAITEAFEAINGVEEISLGDLEDGETINLFGACNDFCDVSLILGRFDGSGRIEIIGTEGSSSDPNEKFCSGKSPRKYKIARCQMDSLIESSSNFTVTVKSTGEPKNVVIKLKGKNIEQFTRLTTNTTEATTASPTDVPQQ